jgi:hypothetical protein
MTIVPIMWSVWGLLLAATAAIFVYRARLTRDEEDQIFLGDGFEHEKLAQTAIVNKVNKIQPVLTTFEWLAVAATVWVIAYYAIDTYSQFK